MVCVVVGRTGCCHLAEARGQTVEDKIAGEQSVADEKTEVDEQHAADEQDEEG
jgi:hypothetical protein